MRLASHNLRKGQVLHPSEVERELDRTRGWGSGKGPPCLHVTVLPAALASLPSSPVFAVSPASSRVLIVLPWSQPPLPTLHTVLFPWPWVLPRAHSTAPRAPPSLRLPSISLGSPISFLAALAPLARCPRSAPRVRNWRTHAASFLLPTSRSPANPLTVESYQYFPPCCEHPTLFLDGRVCLPSCRQHITQKLKL